MKKLLAFLKLISSIAEFVSMFFAKKQKSEITKKENINKIEAGLEAIPQTKEVIEAKKELKEIKKLSKEEINKKEEELVKFQKVVEDKLQKNVINERMAKTIVEKYKKKRDDNEK
jgi:hypothetical protein